MAINWVTKPFADLTAHELYAIIRLRNAVFVVEQNCVFQDADNIDQHCWHLMGWQGNVLVAYTRLVPPDVCYPPPSIGRVVTDPQHRGQGSGRQLMEVSIDKCFELFGGTIIKIGAQLYLKKFYESLGFVQVGEGYLEDDIPHIYMVLEK